MSNMSGPRGCLLQPFFEAGAPLSASDLDILQANRLQRLRRHRRFLHGAGVYCGLRVVAANDPSLPWDVLVCPGYGLSGCGDEILIAEAARVHLADFYWTRLAERGSSRTAWLAVSAAGIETAMIPIQEGACGCGEPAYRPSRMIDAYRFRLLWSEPLTAAGSVDICSSATPTCPACPDTCDLVLATIFLPPSEEVAITNISIVNVPYAV
jgi:hypothetical protein